MSTPTKEEKAWMKKVENLLMNPPTERLGFYTTGDADLTVYDKTHDPEIDLMQRVEEEDFCVCVERFGAEIGVIRSASNIHSTAG